jgi:hypothetical protein
MILRPVDGNRWFSQLTHKDTPMQSIVVALLALTAAVNVTSGADINPGDSEVDQLRSIVKDLQNQVDALKAQNDDQWLTEQRATEIRGLVQDVLADADTRASLLQSGAMAGYDKNFFVSSADGNYMLKIAGQMQIRYVYNWLDDDESSDDNHRQGFENRRTKLRFFGHVVDPSWQYLVLGAYDRDGGGMILDEAYITKDMGNGMKVRMGQFKPPFMREELISSSRQLAVERSLVNEEFNQDRAQGIEAQWAGDAFRVTAAYSDGFASDNTGWQMEDTEWGAVTARGEWLAMGDWKAIDEFQGWKGGESALMVGAAAQYQVTEFGTLTTGETDFFGLTADVTYKGNGFGVFASGVYRMLDPHDGGSSIDSWGIVIQGSYFFNETLEGFARYEFGDADIDGVEDLSVVTLGVNKYFDKHNLKWQNDVGFALDDVDSFWSTSSAGWRTGADGEIVLRSQFQLLF